MGKNKNNKKGPKANVFKVAGAKSLKKTKAKPVNLGLKDLIKDQVQAIDKEFIEISKKPKASKPSPATVKAPVKKAEKKPVTKEEVAKTAEKVVKMDL
ncbi:unnamed protein product [Chrysodeixis includens]|uniref:Uncharacterized protein n=1 Tax=Chrysodeixis includens TaxID=689277 RepID=A0A9P0FUW9_CHRIL|nr:unnamed protein product [Chrysodeixis includens]